MNRLHPPVLSDCPAADAPTDMPVSVGHPASGTQTVPGSAGILLTVDPWEVEHGDILAGLRTPIASILQNDRGVWYYGDAHGITIARRPHWSKVQVLRGAPGEDCDPRGLDRPARHLEVVPS